MVSKNSCWAWTNQYVGIRVKGPTILEPDAEMIIAMADKSGPTILLTLYSTPPSHFNEADYSKVWSGFRLFTGSHNVHLYPLDQCLTYHFAPHLIKRLLSSVQIDNVAIMWQEIRGFMHVEVTH